MSSVQDDGSSSLLSQDLKSTEDLQTKQIANTAHDLTAQVKSDETISKTIGKEDGKDSAILEKKYTCPICEKENLSKTELKVHINSDCSVVEGTPNTQGTIFSVFPVTAGNRFAGDGDVILSVGKDGGETINFLVYSRVLVSASPVFAKMLGYSSPFSEGQQLKNWTYGMDPVVIKLDDHLEPFHTILVVLFHLIHDVPDDMDVFELAEIAIIVDKYELLPAVHIWKEIWKRGLKLGGVLQETPALLMVGWVFGWADYFQKATHQICLEFSLDANMQFVFKNNKESYLLLPETPGVVIDRMTELVLTARQKINDLISLEEARRLREIGKCCKKIQSGRNALNSKSCDYFQLGNIFELRNKQASDHNPNSTTEYPANAAGASDSDTSVSLKEEWHLLFVNGFRELSLPHYSESYRSDLYAQLHTDCFWLKDVQEKAQEIERTIGWNLHDFAGRSGSIC
ncbi:hypothetical protein BJ508DRAFT_74212 [Ascobolus immersus RN42]|uniref:BTB domain-containing protein n=1 Tax=Ascobolus immersus RN42 TaxID=1160509 RepID=A0A3N4IEK6_ASCIM|nr:hypothetical protein BJ508DRAFT_74212 [Ascobolus immersus RN42]